MTVFSKVLKTILKEKVQSLITRSINLDQPSILNTLKTRNLDLSGAKRSLLGELQTRLDQEFEQCKSDTERHSLVKAILNEFSKRFQTLCAQYNTALGHTEHSIISYMEFTETFFLQLKDLNLLEKNESEDYLSQFWHIHSDYWGYRVMQQSAQKHNLLTYDQLAFYRQWTNKDVSYYGELDELVKNSLRYIQTLLLAIEPRSEKIKRDKVKGRPEKVECEGEEIKLDLEKLKQDAAMREIQVMNVHYQAVRNKPLYAAALPYDDHLGKLIQEGLKQPGEENNPKAAGVIIPKSETALRADL